MYKNIWYSKKIKVTGIQIKHYTPLTIEML